MPPSFPRDPKLGKHLNRAVRVPFAGKFGAVVGAAMCNSCPANTYADTVSPRDPRFHLGCVLPQDPSAEGSSFLSTGWGDGVHRMPRRHDGGGHWQRQRGGLRQAGALAAERGWAS